MKKYNLQFDNKFIGVIDCPENITLSAFKAIISEGVQHHLKLNKAPQIDDFRANTALNYFGSVCGKMFEAYEADIFKPKQHQEGATTEIKISDALNPIYMLSDVHTKLLLQVANGNINCQDLALLELKNRGLDINGNWVGPNKN